MKRFLYVVYLLVIFFVVLEIALRIYNPFHLRLKGDKIILPVNIQTTINNRINPKLDPVIVNSSNSLGLRGPELPRTTDSLLKIITIGGSTTECHFLDDKKTWPYLLGKKLTDSFPCVWLNNAGLDGHSTFGHIVLLNGHIKQLRPAVILFMPGINDIELADPTFHDKLNTKGAVPDWKHYVFENSEVLNLGLNLVRGWRAQKFVNTTNSMFIPDSMQKRQVTGALFYKRVAAQKPYLEGYRRRLAQMADTCIAWHILPVFVTQALLCGEGKDSLTGDDLALIPAWPDDTTLNGKLFWTMLEQYNDVARSLAASRHLPLIDLAGRMPKNSLYYYDMCHFTNQGAAEVSSIVAQALTPILVQHFPFRCPHRASN